jgi:hypothetical protein
LFNMCIFCQKQCPRTGRMLFLDFFSPEKWAM